MVPDKRPQKHKRETAQVLPDRGAPSGDSSLSNSYHNTRSTGEDDPRPETDGGIFDHHRAADPHETYTHPVCRFQLQRRRMSLLALVATHPEKPVGVLATLAHRDRALVRDDLRTLRKQGYVVLVFDVAYKATPTGLGALDEAGWQLGEVPRG